MPKKAVSNKAYTIHNQQNGDCLHVEKLPKTGEFILKIDGLWYSAAFILPKNSVNDLVDILLDEVPEVMK